MVQIPDSPVPGQRILLIPAMLDDHFPLLQYAFYTPEYYPVILENRRGIEDLGLRRAHNDMCYPFILSLGQYLDALDSGAYDLDRVSLLMPSAGDACRGSNFTSLTRKGLAAAGYGQVEVLTLNVKGLEKGQALPIRPYMVWRALFGLFYGDLLMLLTHQTRPYEKTPGDTAACRAKWTARLAQDLKTGRHLTLRAMKQTFSQAAADFAAIPRAPRPRKRVALVGELYTKYCALGNWDMVAFLEREGCEAAVNGFSWYILYYVDNQIAGTSGPRRAGWKAVSALLAGLQRSMTEALRAHGFCCLDPFPAFRCQAERDMSMNLQVADGWLMGAEMAAHLRSGCARVLAMQPFGCLPNHVCGRGQYAALARRFPQGKVVSVDLDSSGSPAQVYNRVKMLLEG
ncbi:MAG: hypothetical protein MR419_10210 [Clostridiales bacterium]|nr:hypothetical protein [Clostridiales bacterium]